MLVKQKNHPNQRGVWRGSGKAYYPAILSCFHAYWYTDWCSGTINGNITGNSVLIRGININCNNWHNSDNFPIDKNGKSRLQIANALIGQGLSGTVYPTITAKSVVDSLIYRTGLTTPYTDIVRSRIIQTATFASGQANRLFFPNAGSYIYICGLVFGTDVFC